MRLMTDVKGLAVTTISVFIAIERLAQLVQ